MQLRADIQLQTAIRALTEVVAPAVDAGNALAVEQLQVVIGMLHLMAVRLPLQVRYDCDELARLLELSKALSAELDDDGHQGTISALVRRYWPAPRPTRRNYCRRYAIYSA